MFAGSMRGVSARILAAGAFALVLLTGCGDTTDDGLSVGDDAPGFDLLSLSAKQIGPDLVILLGYKEDDLSRITVFLDTDNNDKNGYAYIHIVEARAKAMDSADEADSLLVIAESRDGFSKAWFHTVAMKGNEKLLMDAVEVDGSKLDGRFTGIFENG